MAACMYTEGTAWVVLSVIVYNTLRGGEPTINNNVQL